MDISTKYMGLKLRSPLVAAASPLTHDVGNVKKLEDAGAGAVVFHSLFQEQILQDRNELEHYLTQGTESFAEAVSFFPQASEFKVGPEEYLANIAQAKKSVQIPVIGSLNGIDTGGWTDYAKKIQEAGADALELNIYSIPSNPKLAAKKVEDVYIEVVKAVKSSVTIPVAVKISPFFSNPANMARRLDRAGADALVLFNRFYQPDIDLEALEAKPQLHLSTQHEMLLPMRWIGILHGCLKTDLAGTSGIHTAEDVVKMIMVGANVTQLCSVLLMKGIDHLRELEKGLREWMEKKEYASVKQMRGSMSQKKGSNPGAFERAQYMKVLQSYHA
ncbi:MAG: dihydroorotate dehydrogenase-like protein [Verrucomicrobiae bacterium]|nr:dihydroorotate dehydrogenase-like protein [Verrucomicrobiae bacterium]